MPVVPRRLWSAEGGTSVNDAGAMREEEEDSRGSERRGVGRASNGWEECLAPLACLNLGVQWKNAEEEVDEGSRQPSNDSNASFASVVELLICLKVGASSV